MGGVKSFEGSKNPANTAIPYDQLVHRELPGVSLESRGFNFGSLFSWIPAFTRFLSGHIKIDMHPGAQEVKADDKPFEEGF